MCSGIKPTAEVSDGLIRKIIIIIIKESWVDWKHICLIVYMLLL